MSKTRLIPEKLKLILLAIWLLFSNVSLAMAATEELPAEQRYAEMTFVRGIDPDLMVYINKKSLNIDLLRTNNIRVRIKTSHVYSAIDKISSFKISMYEIVNGERRFVSSQTLTVFKGTKKSRVISIAAGYFAAPTKQVEFDVFDTEGNLINTYSAELSATHLDSQVAGGDGVNLNAADCDYTNFDDCQLDYLFDRITFEAKPQKQISTRIVKSEEGLYKVTIPVPRSQFKFLGRSVTRGKKDGLGNGGGLIADSFGDTLSISTIKIGPSASNYGVFSYDPFDHQFTFGPSNASTPVVIGADGKLGIGVDPADAFLDVRGGDGTSPSMILEPGTLATTPVNGALEFDGNNFYFTKNGVRGVIGAQGPTGPAGPTGPTGPAGSGGSGSLSSPTLVSVSPVDNSTGIGINDNLVINFSTVVAEGNGNITIHKVSDDSIIETIDSNDTSKLTFSNNKVTINPSSTFDYLTGYYVLIENGAIASGLDVSDGWVGISTTTDWNFTTANPATIAVSSLSPADNATGVSRTGTFAITFNVPVNLNTGNVTFKKSSDNSIFDQFSIGSGQVTRSNGNRTVTFDPSGTLNYSNGYYIEIASTAIENFYTGGEYFAGYSGPTSWNFTVQGPASLSVEETFNLPTNTTTYSSTTNVANMQSSDTPVRTVTMTNNKVAGDSTVVVAFNIVTNLPSTITLVGGTVITFGTDAVVPDSLANRYVVPTQEYSFYVDTGTNKLVIRNEASAFGVFTARTITAVFAN